MADLETRVEKLENEFVELKLHINSSLSDIHTDVAEIKSLVKSNDNTGELKNEIIKKDVDSNTSRIKKLENNQSKLIWLLIGELAGIVASILF